MSGDGVRHPAAKDDVTSELDYVGVTFTVRLRPRAVGGKFTWMLDYPNGGLLTAGSKPVPGMDEARELELGYLQALWPYGPSNPMGASDTAMKIPLGSDEYTLLLSPHSDGGFRWVLYNPDGAPIAWGEEPVEGMPEAERLARMYLARPRE